MCKGTTLDSHAVNAQRRLQLSETDNHFLNSYPSQGNGQLLMLTFSLGSHSKFLCQKPSNLFKGAITIEPVQIQFFSLNSCHHLFQTIA